MLKKIKSCVVNIPNNVRNKVDTVKFKAFAPVFAFVGTASTFALSASAEDLQGWTSSVNASMFDGMFADIKALVPVLLPVIVSFLAFRKGWGFLKGQIKGA